MSAALKSAAKIWRRHLGVDLKVPSKVRVLRARLRVIRGYWGAGMVGWVKLRQEDGESLGIIAQAAELSGVGMWRSLGFGGVETNMG